MKTGRRVPVAARRGLTATEVVVVIFVLAVMAALILPAMQQTRAGDARSRCQNNMKQLVTATANYASRHGGYLPQLYASYSFDPDGSNPKIPDTICRSWAVALLPVLDQAAVFRAISTFDADDGLKGSPGDGRDFEWPSLKDLQCPQSIGHLNQPGALSYVANAGYIDASVWHNSVLSQKHHALAYDWDGEPGITENDLLISHSTGAFWRPTTKTDHDSLFDRRGISLDFIGTGDGQSNTILFAENLQAGRWDRAENLWEISFGLKVELSGPNAEFGTAPETLLRLPQKLKHVADFLPCTRIKAAVGTAPRPSSSHEGICMYGFADGSAKQISDNIDPLVYARLLTPNGQRHGQLLDGLDEY